MRGSFFALLKKDFRLMVSSKFFLLAIGSLILYSCYINLVYVKVDQEIFPVYLYDPEQVQENISADVISVYSPEELQNACEDGYSIGIDASKGTPRIIIASCGISRLDEMCHSYALSKLSSGNSRKAKIIGPNDKEMKNRREITAEFLFFELAAVGFLGLASMLFKEKQMGVIRVHAVLSVQKGAFILSKLILILFADLLFAALLTLCNLGVSAGVEVLPKVLVQAGILSMITAMAGFFFSITLPDFKQFSLLYLVLAVFITTPVFLAGQTGVEMSWIKFHPMYHLFAAMKNAYFQAPVKNGFYYAGCLMSIFLLFLLARYGLDREMKREG